MAKNTSITLGDHFERFINQQVSKGRYASASEVLREGLRLVEEREGRLDALRQALQAGVDSGPAAPLDMEAVIKAARAKAGLNA